MKDDLKREYSHEFFCFGGMRFEMRSSELCGLMNNTKWEEIRMAMYDYPHTVRWRTKCVDNGYISNWDAEWYYHFQLGGYTSIEWLEIKVENSHMKSEIVNILKNIHVPGEVLENSIKVFGYKSNGFVDYI